MILYSDTQLDEAWRYDCKQRSLRNLPWIERTVYENLFVKFLDAAIAGVEYIDLNIFIPIDYIESLDHNINLETGYTDD